MTWASHVPDPASGPPTVGSAGPSGEGTGQWWGEGRLWEMPACPQRAASKVCFKPEGSSHHLDFPGACGSRDVMICRERNRAHGECAGLSGSPGAVSDQQSRILL